MKKHITLLLPILVAMFALAPVSTNAQSAQGVRADVPFEFMVGDKTFAAGTIVTNGPTSDIGSLSVTNLDSREHVFRIARTMSGPHPTDQAKLVFRKYGNQYYLAEIWIPNYKVLEVTKSKSERALERELRLAKNSKPELVNVIASLR